MRIAIVNAFRTPIGKFGGAFKDTPPDKMVAIVMKNNLSAAGLDGNQIDEVIVGQTKQSADYPNIARVALLKASMSESTSAHTVNMQCGSGMQAIINGCNSILTGHSEVVLAGGVESMSQAPYYFSGNRFGIKPGTMELKDSNTESQKKSQPEEIYGTFNMGMTAENLSEQFNISREEQDEFALLSQQRAKNAILENLFEEEIVPIDIRVNKKTNIYFNQDEFPREATMEQLTALPPVFKEGGTVTAGNTTGRNDGAAMVLLMSEDKAIELNLKPLGYIKSYATVGVHPSVMGIGPVDATRKALEKCDLAIEDIDLFEINEAFAAQTLAVIKELNLNVKKVNINGGAIALGHPLGSSGARILTTLVYEMKRKSLKYGVATLCVAGGQGIAMVVERDA